MVARESESAGEKTVILVLPFCARDGALAVKNLLWMEELDGKLPFGCVLSHDTETPAGMVAEMTAIATRIFNKVDVFWYPAPEKKHWPAAPNHAWRNVAQYVSYKYNEPWLFLEADAIPIRKGWLQDIADEHQRGGKPFSGHIVVGMGHVNGSCVYPPDVSAYSVGAFRTEETAWDVVLGMDLKTREGGVSCYVHPSHNLFQHCWAINPADGKAWNGSGSVATFKGFNDLLRLVDLTMGVFHRCKDGTLIDWLRKYHQDPSAAMVPQHTQSDVENKSRVAEAKADRRGEGLGNNADVLPAGNVSNNPNPNDQDRPENKRDSDVQPEQPASVDQLPVQHDPQGSAASGGKTDRGDGKRETVETEKPVQEEAFKGACEIFIVTYGLPTKRVSGLMVSDFDWLVWCLRSIRRHATGFSGITIAIPNRDAELLRPIADEHAKSKCGIPLRIKMYTEKAGKGHIQHMAVMASADDFVPHGTSHVLHVDADVIFNKAVTPARYFPGGKAQYLVRTYDSLAEMRDGQQVVSDCAQWRKPTADQLGFDPEVYSMCVHPVGFPISFYKPYRNHVANVQGKPFLDYMLSGRNAFPPDRMDFTAMGAWAWRAMKNDFAWVDISAGNHLAPPENHKCYWSHGGVTPHIESEIKSFLA